MAINLNSSGILNIQDKPFQLLGMAGFILAIFSFLPVKIDSLDVNIYDTYFVFDYMSFVHLFAVMLLFFWLIYVLSKRFMLLNILTWVHVGLTLLTIIVFLILLSRNWDVDKIPKRTLTFAEFEEKKSPHIAVNIGIGMLVIFLIGQICFIINLIGGLLGHLHKRFMSRVKSR